MARAKNRGYQQSNSPSYTIRRWKMGGYIRLSKEDLKKAREGKDDSNSVKNQRDLLNDFYRKHIDEFESMDEYVDDGHTGTDADREDFQRLLADVMSGRINCVIVKDLSRFARNYSDAGSLIDNLFVQMGVRFISLAENVDSYRDPDSVSSIIVPITNVMNDQYCYQTSKKIRQVFDYKRRSGQYSISVPLPLMAISKTPRTSTSLSWTRRPLKSSSRSTLCVCKGQRNGTFPFTSTNTAYPAPRHTDGPKAYLFPQPLTIPCGGTG